MDVIKYYQLFADLVLRLNKFEDRIEYFRYGNELFNDLRNGDTNEQDFQDSYDALMEDIHRYINHQNL